MKNVDYIEETRRLEFKIQKEKNKRKEEILTKIAIVVTIILVLWVLLSWAEVLSHRDIYYRTGEWTDYCPINIFNIIIKLGEIIYEK